MGDFELKPMYRSIKEHTNTVLVEYDPDVINFEEILVEWAKLDYPYPKSKTQYHSAFWYTSEEQREVVEETGEAICAGAWG